MADIKSDKLFSSLNSMLSKNVYPSIIASHMINENLN